MQDSVLIVKPNNQLKGQLRECYEFAKRNDYVVVNEYIDRAISGMTDNRQHFCKWLKIAKRKSLNMCWFTN